MTTEGTMLNPRTVLEQFRKNGVTHVVYLPESESDVLFRAMQEQASIDVVSVAREAETMAVAAGIYVGGKKPVCMLQNTGLLESGDSIRGLGMDCNLPIVMLIGYRGWTRWGLTSDSVAPLTEPTLHAWGVHYYLVEHDNDADRISLAFEEAARTRKPVAVLMADEYHGFNRVALVREREAQQAQSQRR